MFQNSFLLLVVVGLVVWYLFNRKKSFPVKTTVESPNELLRYFKEGEDYSVLKLSQTIQEVTAGRVNISDAVLYHALDQLTLLGQLERRKEPVTVGQGEDSITVSKKQHTLSQKLMRRIVSDLKGAQGRLLC